MASLIGLKNIGKVNILVRMLDDQMTKEEILALEIEDSLNEMVANQIMGECYHDYWTEDGKDSINCLKCGESRFYHQHSQNYSTDISAAWQVIGKMLQEHYKFALNKVGSEWYCAFWHTTRNKSSCYCVNVFEAICKAALLTRYSVENS
jgi:Zn ribbon nucleic-acid-binding protein